MVHRVAPRIHGRQRDRKVHPQRVLARHQLHLRWECEPPLDAREQRLCSHCESESSISIRLLRLPPFTGLRRLCGRNTTRYEGPVKADGFSLLSNTSGLYLGDPILRPILADLDARKALVFVHPTSPCQHRNGGVSCSATERYANSAPLAALYRAPLFEFFFDSGRSVLDLLMSGSACRFPHIRWILTHCGGVLPSLVDRTILVLRLGQGFTTDRDGITVTEQQIVEALRKQFWFDLAGNPVPNQMDALLRITGKEQLLFGSDVPWTPFEAAGKLVEIVQQELPACVGRKIWTWYIERTLSDCCLPERISRVQGL